MPGESVKTLRVTFNCGLLAEDRPKALVLVEGQLPDPIDSDCLYVVQTKGAHYTFALYDPRTGSSVNIDKRSHFYSALVPFYTKKKDEASNPLLSSELLTERHFIDQALIYKAALEAYEAAGGAEYEPDRVVVALQEAPLGCSQEYGYELATLYNIVKAGKDNSGHITSDHKRVHTKAPCETGTIITSRQEFEKTVSFQKSAVGNPNKADVTAIISYSPEGSTNEHVKWIIAESNVHLESADRAERVHQVQLMQQQLFPMVITTIEAVDTMPDEWVILGDTNYRREVVDLGHYRKFGSRAYFDLESDPLELTLPDLTRMYQPSDESPQKTPEECQSVMGAVLAMHIYHPTNAEDQPVDTYADQGRHARPIITPDGDTITFDRKRGQHSNGPLDAFCSNVSYNEVETHALGKVDDSGGIICHASDHRMLVQKTKLTIMPRTRLEKMRAILLDFAKILKLDENDDFKNRLATDGKDALIQLYNMLRPIVDLKFTEQFYLASAQNIRAKMASKYAEAIAKTQYATLTFQHAFKAELTRLGLSVDELSKTQLTQIRHRVLRDNTAEIQEEIRSLSAARRTKAFKRAYKKMLKDQGVNEETVSKEELYRIQVQVLEEHSEQIKQDIGNKIAKTSTFDKAWHTYLKNNRLSLAKLSAEEIESHMDTCYEGLTETQKKLIDAEITYGYRPSSKKHKEMCAAICEASKVHKVIKHLTDAVIKCCAQEVDHDAVTALEGRAAKVAASIKDGSIMNRMINGIRNFCKAVGYYIKRAGIALTTMSDHGRSSTATIRARPNTHADAHVKQVHEALKHKPK